jgi:hypothetical protein
MSWRREPTAETLRLKATERGVHCTGGEARPTILQILASFQEWDEIVPGEKMEGTRAKFGP